jgi:hypothetical protein
MSDPEASSASNFGLAQKFSIVRQFIVANSDLAPKAKKNEIPMGESYWQRLEEIFTAGRAPKAPKEPSTVSDELISLVLQEAFQVDTAKLAQYDEAHRLSMAAENITGHLLESYLAEQLEPLGWVWCSGSVVKAVDFIGFDLTNPSEPFGLQIKNRNNTENSSSNKVREGTEILCWVRSNSRTGAFYWDKFPGKPPTADLSEDTFRLFVQKQLRTSAT